MNQQILIVDDVPANLKILSDLLETEGYNILVAPNGEVALKVAAGVLPDLILLDVMMPGIDGFTTCQKLKENPNTAEIPVIFVTAQDEIENIVHGFEVGGVDYIQKPFEREEVRARVETHLTIKRLRDELEADNRRKTEELQTARAIQRGFLPVVPPSTPFVEIASFQQAATEVGGDYYDFFPQSADKLIVAIGDATGHGVGAALMVSATKMALMTNHEPSLEKKIGKLNTDLKRINSYPRLNMALTLVEFSFNPGLGMVRVTASGGGMPPPYLLRVTGDIEEITVQGLPLGAMEGATYGTTEFQMERSSILVLMSDGLPERENDQGEQFGYSAISAHLQKIAKTGLGAQEVVDMLLQKSEEWSKGTPQNDDVTIVVLKVR